MPLAFTGHGQQPQELIPHRPDTRTDAQKLADRQSGLIAAIRSAAEQLAHMKPENRIAGLARFDGLSHDILNAVIELREIARDRAAL